MYICMLPRLSELMVDNCGALRGDTTVAPQEFVFNCIDVVFLSCFGCQALSKLDNNPDSPYIRGIGTKLRLNFAVSTHLQPCCFKVGVVITMSSRNACCTSKGNAKSVW